ncbi:MAG: hypothetical protein K8L97_03395 [Anaerolineae bacterium]|nr:hypothetical protein [Anaerolineae bacterium]
MLQKVSIFLLALLFVTHPVSAQLSSYCGQLSETDCALMLDAQQSLQELHSATLNRASMISQNLHDDFRMEVSASGTVANLPLMQGLNLTAAPNLNAELTIAVDLSNLPTGLPSWEDMPEHAEINVRVIDGILYIDMDSLVPPNPTLHGWVSIELSTLMPPMPNTEPPPPTPEGYEPLLTGTNVDQLAAVFDQEVLNQFVNVVRSGDTFETWVDFAAMYAHPIFQTALRESLINNHWANIAPNTVTDEALNELAAMMAEIFPEPIMLNALTVDPEERVVRGFQFWGMLDFSVMIEAGIKGNDITQWSQSSFQTNADFDNYNQVVLAVAPVDAQPISPDILQNIPIMRMFFPLPPPPQNTDG